ncbi:MAG TPA: hypothetical protein DCM08_04035 [Microscillaceae bacterium]|jgi:hypothetical protein|nr:hypothetical protein [Microscillaceae bacterium]
MAEKIRDLENLRAYFRHHARWIKHSTLCRILGVPEGAIREFLRKPIGLGKAENRIWDWVEAETTYDQTRNYNESNYDRRAKKKGA